MNWERLKVNLEHILNAPAHFRDLPAVEWDKLCAGRAAAERERKSVVCGNKALFYLFASGDTVHALEVEARLAPSERRLIEMTVDAYRERETVHAPMTDSEQERMLRLRDWILYHLEEGTADKPLPDAFVSEPALFETNVPLLLYGDYSDNRRVAYDELKKLLESFFDASILLVPLKDKEWLILGGESLLSDSVGGGDKDED